MFFCNIYERTIQPNDSNPFPRLDPKDTHSLTNSTSLSRSLSLPPQASFSSLRFFQEKSYVVVVLDTSVP